LSEAAPDRDTLALTDDGIEIPNGVDLSEGVVFRARGATVDHKPGSADRPFYPAIDEDHLEAEQEYGVINEHLEAYEVTIKTYGEAAETYHVQVPATDGGRPEAFPGDDLWSDYRDAEIGIGDVVVDLSRGASLQVTSVATKRAGEHPNVRSDRTADMFGVADDELVFDCVFLPDGDDAVSPPSKTYAYPASRLLRYPVEQATSNERLQREWLTNVLEDLAVEANDLSANHRICLREVVSEAFGSDVAGLLEEFAEAAGGEA
jgi:hypothetical protein